MQSYLTEIQYFMPVIAAKALWSSKYVLFEQYETYQKMSFRNRMYISGSHGAIALTVPLAGGRQQRALIKDVRIDNSAPWAKHHIKALDSSYNRSAFYFHYRPALEKLLLEPNNFLWDLNWKSFDFLRNVLKWQGTVDATTTYKKTYADEIDDARNRFLPSKMETFQVPDYYQVFPLKPAGSLSVLDLIFNLGPAANGYLQA